MPGLLPPSEGNLDMRLLIVLAALSLAACDLSGPSFGPSPFRQPPAPRVMPPVDAPTAPAPDVHNEPIRTKTVHTWAVYWTNGQPHGDPTIEWDDVYGPPPISAFNHAGHGGCVQVCTDGSTVLFVD